MKARRTWWIVYGAGAAVVVLALAWVTTTMVRLEQAELDANAKAVHQESMRLALWRMDSWLSPRLARESARPIHEYQAFYPQQIAYTKLLNEIEAGEVLTPSPLLSFDSEFIKLHFQVTPDGAITSPQAPTGNLRELAEIKLLSTDELQANDVTLAALRGQVTPQQLEMSCISATAQFNMIAETPLPELPPQLPPRKNAKWAEMQKSRGAQELAARQNTYAQTAGYGLEASTDFVGPLAPVWSNDQLILVRQVRWQDRKYLQGFLCDWPRLRELLLVQVEDLFPVAELRPVPASSGGDDSFTMLATVPVSLDVPPPPAVAASMASPARSTMLLTWLVVLGAIGAVGVALRASLVFGDKRSRFASAVTHELRTPLTTFRMYTEMLAEGMVADEAKRQRYLETLHDESGRLSRLVENVLCYARLEEGRHTAHTETTTIEELIERVTTPLERRAEEAGLSLKIECDAPADVELTTDAGAVEQILFNLVDNACKYAPGPEGQPIALQVARVNGAVMLDVRDEGPGVPAGETRTIFTPFERGESQANGDAPGIGLGLALSRQLARELGGDLTLRPCDTGACFRLELPSP